MEPRIGIAAGMIKSHVHLPHRLLRQRLLSSITFGSYTLERRDGNPDPNIWISPDGRWMLNAIGLKNEGLGHFINHELMELHEACFGVTELRVSLAPTGTGELRDMVSLLNLAHADEFIDELEINAACPNHKKGEHIEPVLAHDMDAVEGLLHEASGYRGAKALKIAPHTGHTKLPKLIELCEAYDINTLVSANTLKHTATIEGTQVLSVESGGQSGYPLMAHTIVQVGLLTHLIEDTGVDLRVVACGGVMEAEQAENLLTEQGADEVQVATLFWTQGEDGIAKLVTETGLRMAA